MSSAHIFSGIYAPIATPFTQDNHIHWEALANNLAFYNQSRLAGVVVLGSNGEFALLSHQEKLEMIRFVREHLVKEKLVIAGTGCESTAETMELGAQAAAVGAAAALVVTPWYYKGSYTDPVLEKHYHTIADASPIPVMLYNMPRNTGLNLAPAIVNKLAQHPNIIGVKDSSGDIVQITNIINNTPADFSVFAGSGSFLMATILAGGVGGTLAIANIMPDTCVELYEASLQGDLPKARALQKLIMQPNAAVTTGMGIAGLKKALDLIGLYGGKPRPPLQPVSPEDGTRLVKILQDAGVTVT
ncbi:MAG: dihydrodipicolinate synthase family protein [Symbiobacteriaceae bacterium]|nr:dihydrodipicolinate synthase family protein [Symbiobacteriaceae bacterium]